jgi:dihydropyrimidinase
MCERPARIFGLYPRKGILVEGSDADVVVFDPSITSTITARNPRLKVDYSLYENRTCLGAPVMVMQRGRILMEGGKLIGKPGGGRFLPGKNMDKSRADLGNRFH